ncbi:MAG: hypothetical protein ACHBNF_15710 [Chromatiales bacterium]
MTDANAIARPMVPPNRGHDETLFVLDPQLAYEPQRCDAELRGELP